MKYDHKKIETKWQNYWNDKNFYKADDNSKKEKKYVLSMFPYPSGSGLHMGHMATYTPADIYARFLRMKGYEVLNPIGWDAFGLPAENYAIKTGIHPEKSTNKAINNFKRQLKSVGFSLDWNREIGTHNPDYYKWTQWFFLLMYKNNLAYKKKGEVNWCDSCKTVLAREQVEGGVCERCGTEVQNKELEQWYFKITDYADELIEGLDGIDWPESTKITQKNWIGKSKGAEIKFSIEDLDEKIEVFTTRPDTIFGATYMVIAPEHSIVEKMKNNADNKDEIEKYVEEAKKKLDVERMSEEKEKTGVKIKGIKAINPATKEKIPIFIADYVLSTYGTGAIMSVPAHDERDLAFAIKYNLPIRYVVAPHNVDPENRVNANKPEAYPRSTIHAIVYNSATGKYLALDWKEYSWKTFVIGGVKEDENLEEAARREVYEETGYKNLKLKRVVEWPIKSEYFAAHKDENRIAYTHAVFFEMEDCERDEVSGEELMRHEPIWVDIEDLPEDFVCPELDIWLSIAGEGYADRVYTEEGVLINSGDFTGEDTTEAKEKIVEFLGGEMKTTYRLRDWLISRQRYWGAPIPIVYDPSGNPQPVPEKYLPWLLPDDVGDKPPEGVAPLGDSKELKDRVESIFGNGWMPEVDTMDTFVCSSWYYLRYTDPKNEKKFADIQKIHKWMPVDVYIGGAEHAVLHLMYSRFFTKVLQKLGFVDFDEPFQKLKHQGIILAEDGGKMSKSKGNVVNPDEVIEKFGADTARMFQMFLGPLEDSKPWDSQNLIGIRRFLDRVWRLFERVDSKVYEDDEIKKLSQKTIKKVGEDIENFKFNTAISQLMIFVNALQDRDKIESGSFIILLKLLAPFAPHITEELWANIGKRDSIHKERWPEYDENFVKEDNIKIAVQINGKVRDEIEVKKDAEEDEVFESIPSHIIEKWVAGKNIKKKIYVPGKIFNIVVDEKQ